MSNYRARGLTDGYLPEEAFEHLAPTAMGYIDLEQPLVVHHPDPDAGAFEPGSRDALVLARLHDEPLAVVHVEHALGEGTPERLAAAVWRQAGAEARAHCERYGCRPAPTDATDLLAGLGTPDGGCPGAHVANVDATATIVIPTGGRAAKLTRCLESICRLTHPHFDVVIVDNQPHVPGTADVVDAFAGRLQIRYVPEPRPGSSVARNRGVAESRAEFVAFGDDDIILDPHWLSWLMHPFAEPAVLAVTGMILPLELRTESQKRLEQYAGFSKGVVEHRYDLGPNRAFDRVLYPYWGGMFGSGASMAFRREDLARAGGLDPALGAGSLARAGADIEVLTAAILRGGQVVYSPRALCWHEHTQDDTALRRQLYNYGIGFTAIMTKYLTHDPRFLGAFARSVPLALKRRRENEHNGGVETSRLPGDLARVERMGMLRGPWLYARSLLWARRLKLHDAVRGR